MMYHKRRGIECRYITYPDGQEEPCEINQPSCCPASNQTTKEQARERAGVGVSWLLVGAKIASVLETRLVVR